MTRRRPRDLTGLSDHANLLDGIVVVSAIRLAGLEAGRKVADGCGMSDVVEPGWRSPVARRIERWQLRAK